MLIFMKINFAQINIHEIIIYYFFSSMWPNICDKNAGEMQITDKLVNAFPNVIIALRIYLAIFGTTCEGERLFSVLKRVKNCLRSTLGQDRMAALSLLSIESEVLRTACTENIC